MRIYLAVFAAFAVSYGLAAELKIPSTADQPPRKVIVGTAMQAFWGEYPGLEKRLEQLSELIDQMAVESQKKYGRSLDLAVLPEMAVTGEISGDIVAHSVPLEGSLRDTFARKARQHNCYIVAPTFLLEDREKKVCSNAAILIGRKGELVGIYRKLHLAVQTASDSLEGGMTPGKEAPVFHCDFGKLGIQICFDIEYDYGWQELARKGAELVVWPTQSPQTTHPAARAIDHRYYIVSSTWRNNASFFEPTGKIVAQIREPAHILVEELDLSYAILPWSPGLQKGAALRKKYGDKVGFRYYEDEDRGIFWSNDTHIPIGEMARSLGLSEAHEELQRIRRLYDKIGVPGSR
jgi:predicted amidohydrolase